MFEPKATAPHLDSTKKRNTRCEQMFSAIPATADIRRAMFVSSRTGQPMIAVDLPARRTCRGFTQFLRLSAWAASSALALKLPESQLHLECRFLIVGTDSAPSWFAPSEGRHTQSVA
jgi:hypothetical protein